MHRLRVRDERGPDCIGASDPHVRPLADSRECPHLGSLADFRNQGFGIPHARYFQPNPNGQDATVVRGKAVGLLSLLLAMDS